MPKKKGTAKSLTPKKASKRKIIIKRPSKVVKSKPTKKTNPKKKISKAKSTKSNAGVHSFVGVDGKKYTLTAKEYKFADLMCTLEYSGFQAVIEAGYDVYDDKGKINKNTTWSIASQNLSKLKIQQYINKQLESVRLTKEAVMLELAQMLFQKYDNKTKSKAMDMFFKLTGEYAPDKHEHQFDKELQESLAKIAKVLP